MVDAAVIGAGPAGSAAAIELVCAGRSVLLIERKAFPRNKVCGGCLSGPAAVSLKQLLGPDRPPPGIPGSKVSFVMGSYRLTCNPRGETWMVWRPDMDAALAEAAVEAGAEIRYGHAAAIEPGVGGWEVVVDRERIRATQVLIATGLGSLAAKLGVQNKARSRAMISQQWVQPSQPPLPAVGCVELHWLRDGYVGLATPKPGECVVALACHAPAAGEESAFDHLRRRSPDAEIWRVLPADAPRRYGAKGIAGFPWMPDRLGDRNAILIGDAAGYAEPYSGEGIGQAMASATCAVQAILQGGDVLSTYAGLMRRNHQRVVWRMCFLSAILSSSIMQFIGSRRPVLPRQWLTRLVEGVHVKGSI